jgi:hypothetical protein
MNFKHKNNITFIFSIFMLHMFSFYINVTINGLFILFIVIQSDFFSNESPMFGTLVTSCNRVIIAKHPKHCRSQWPRRLKHELSSFARTLGSRIRISLKA